MRPAVFIADAVYAQVVRDARAAAAARGLDLAAFDAEIERRARKAERFPNAMAAEVRDLAERSEPKHEPRRTPLPSESREWVCSTGAFSYSVDAPDRNAAAKASRALHKAAGHPFAPPQTWRIKRV